MSDEFSIRILRQGWLNDDSACDLCSHGEIELHIGGGKIVGADQACESGSYGISEAALGLLRTLKYRHTAEHRVAERLIPHGCGTMLMAGCNIGVDWTVRHCGDSVHISDVVRYDSNAISEAVQFRDIDIRISWLQYARQIVAFAAEAKTLFDGVAKRTSDEAEGKNCDAFWAEFDHLLANWEAVGERDRVRAGLFVEYHH